MQRAPQEALMNTQTQTFEQNSQQQINLAGDLVRTVGLAVAAGMGVALVCSVVVLLITVAGN
jgi:hypothetical protein